MPIFASDSQPDPSFGMPESEEDSEQYSYQDLEQLADKLVEMLKREIRLENENRGRL
jgi:hypothetical protein